MVCVTMDLKGLARLCVYPFSIDICLALEQRLVVELCEKLASQSWQLAEAADIQVVLSGPYLRILLKQLSAMSSSESCSCRRAVVQVIELP